MTLQNAPPGLDYERDKRFSKVCLSRRNDCCIPNRCSYITVIMYGSNGALLC